MTRWLFLVSIILLTAHCDKRRDTKLPDAFVSVTSPQIAIIHYDSSKHRFFHGVTEASLSKLEVDTIESILLNCVTEYNLQLKKSFASDTLGIDVGTLQIDLSRYNRQFVAVLNSNAEKVVYVNCMCVVHDNDDWKNEIEVVDDGGNCYFSLKINLATRNFYDMIVNGDA